jgi:hypothetical protein
MNGADPTADPVLVLGGGLAGATALSGPSCH